jgi:hypothetical protein
MEHIILFSTFEIFIQSIKLFKCHIFNLYTYFLI